MRTDFSRNPLIQKCILFGVKPVEYVEFLEEKRNLLSQNNY